MNEIEQLLATLKDNQLVDDAVIAKLRRKIAKSEGKATPAVVLKYLVQKNHLTAPQAARLQSAPPAAAAAPDIDDEMGLAPLDDDEAPSAKRAPAAADDVDLDDVDVDVDIDDEDEDIDYVDVDVDVDEDLGLVSIDDEPPKKTTKPWSGAAPAQKSAPLSPAVEDLSPADLVDGNELEGEGPSGFPSPAGGGLPPRPQGRRRWGRRDGDGAQTSPWDSTLLLVGGGALLVLVILGGVLIWSLGRGSGDESLALADEDYKAGSYTQAISKYDDYLRRHPSHAGVSGARVRRGLATLRKSVEGSRNWPQALTVAGDVLPRIESEESFTTARGELADLLPEVAEGLAKMASDAPDPDYVAQAETALALVHQYVPSSLKNGQQIANVEASLELTRHRLAQDTRLRETIELMDSTVSDVTAAADFDERARMLTAAYDARKQLLKEYPALAEAPALTEAVRRVSRAEQTLVEFVQDAAASLGTEPSSPIISSAALVIAAESTAEPKQIVFARAAGAVHALDAASGRVLWRRAVGFDAAFTPAVIPGDDDVLLIDSRRHELLRVAAASGALRWRAPLGEPCEAAPLIVGDHVWAAARSGRLLRIKLADGARDGALRIPQGLRVAPAVDAARRLLYQIGEHSNLYVLGAAEGDCREVVYLGHEPSAVLVPPVVFDRYVVIVENDRLREARLRVLLVDEEQQELREVTAFSERISGHVYTPPVLSADQRLLLVATDRGALYAYEANTPGGGPPLTLVADKKAGVEQAVIHYPLLFGSQLWAAGDALTRYNIQSVGGAFSAIGVTDPRSVALQPLHDAGDAVIFVRAPNAAPGVVVSALEKSGGQAIWQTELAAPLAVAPLTGADDERILAVTTSGALYELTADAWSDLQTVNTPRSVADRGARPAVLPRDASLALLDDGRYAVAPSEPPGRILVLNPAAAGEPPRWLRPTVEVASAAVPFGGGLMVADRRGLVAVIDADTGRDLLAPFQPKLTAASEFTWRGPALWNEGQALVADGAANLYRLAVNADPKPHLVAQQQANVRTPITSALAAVGETVYAVDRSGQLFALDAQNLGRGREWDLGAAPRWGPRAVGDVVFVATASDELLCLDGRGELRWRVPLPYGPVAGQPLAEEGAFLFSSTRGVVWRLSAAAGEESSKVDLGEPLASGPVALGNRLVVAGHDGTLHLFERP